MYKIYFVHTNSTQENLLYEPNNSDLSIVSAELSMTCGKAGQLTLVIPQSNTSRNDIKFLTDEIIVKRDGVELFRGRAITKQSDFNLTGTVICEGILAYLYDSYIAPFNYTGDKSVTPTQFLTNILNEHNAQFNQYEPWKKFNVGDVTVTDKNDSISRSSDGYDRTLNVLIDKLSGGSLGGLFRARVTSEGRFIDYLEHYNTHASQRVELKSNILDIAIDVQYGDIMTAILPLGKRDDETGEYLTIKSVNEGSAIYKDNDLVAQYGYICEQVDWEDVTIASNLLTKAKAYLTEHSVPIKTITVNAVDLANAYADVDFINLGDNVTVTSTPHGINQEMELTTITLNLLDPSKDVLTFGTTQTGMSESKAKAEHQVQTIAVSVDKINANYASIAYVSANYVTADTMTGETGVFKRLEATEAVIESLDTTYVKGDTAVFTQVVADTGNIKTLLSGTAGTGALEAININAENAVIANGTITNAMINSVTAGKVTSGTLDTTKVNISSGGDRPHLLIDESTIQINDGQNVRVQIGEDGSEEPDYSIYIYDADGVLLWKPDGITGEGIGSGTIKNINVSDDAAIDGGKLNIDSVVSAINGGTSTLDSSKITIDNKSLTAAYTTLVQNQESFQQQLDNEVSSYAGTEDPTMYNMPAVEWVNSADADAVLRRNVGKIYYNNTNFKSFRFTYEGYYADENGTYLTDENGALLCNYYWQEIKDTESAKALSDAKEALEKASGLEDLIANDYSSTEQIQGMFTVNNQQMKSEISRDYATKASLTSDDGTFMGNYATVGYVGSSIEQTESSIMQTVSQQYLTQTEYSNLRIGGVNMIVQSEDLTGNYHEFFDYIAADENGTLMADENGNVLTI